jgi:hypothetical protein
VLRARLYRAARAVARGLLGHEFAHGARAQSFLLRERGPVWVLRYNVLLTNAWIRDRRARRRYRTLSEEALRSHRTSDTVFVFGSGASLNELTQDEWSHFAEHDTFGFNAFYFQRWVPVSFHLLRGAVYGELRWRPFFAEVADALRGNPNFAGTTFLLQEGYLAQLGNQLTGYGGLPEGADLFRYRTLRGWGPPSRSPRALRHAVGTLDDVVNAAYAIGWREIVLVGVDLYDSRYFFLPADQTVTLDAATGALGPGDANVQRGNRADDPHNTAAGAVRLLGEWRPRLEAEGVRLSVYNPRSLLAGVLPLYRAARMPSGAQP